MHSMTAASNPALRMRVAIADDEPLARRRLRSLLARHADVEIVAECANGPALVAAIEQHRPAAVFLDVQMPGMTGVDVMRAVGPHAVPAVVLVTAFDEHAIDAFEQQALDYVLKPVDDERFDRALGRVRERVAQRSASALAEGALRLLAQREAAPPAAPAKYATRLLLRSTEKLSFVEVGAIDWVEADGDYVRLHTAKGTHLHRSTLAAIEAQLDPAAFVRIHRSTIVRTERIRELQPYFHGEYVVVLRDGSKLKLSRSYREKLEGALGERL